MRLRQLVFTSSNLEPACGAVLDGMAFEDVDTAPLDPGTDEHGIFTGTDSETATLTVEGETNETPETETPDAE